MSRRGCGLRYPPHIGRPILLTAEFGRLEMMIEDLRFVEREIDNGDGTAKTVRILQASDGHVWFDVPLYDEDGNKK